MRMVSMLKALLTWGHHTGVLGRQRLAAMSAAPSPPAAGPDYNGTSSNVLIIQ